MEKRDFRKWIEYHCLRFSDCGQWLMRKSEDDRVVLLEAWRKVLLGINLFHAKAATDHLLAEGIAGGFDGHPAAIRKTHYTVTQGLERRPIERDTTPRKQINGPSEPLSALEKSSALRYKFGEGMPLADWQSMPDGKEKYQAYLCSREWAERRNAVLERCGSVCERCNSNPVDAVHHKTYARKYNERPEDLAGRCQGCHDFTHGKSDVDPAAAAKQKLLEMKPLHLPNNNDGLWGTHFLCPYCECENCHIGQAEWVDESREGNQGRVTVPIECEWGHRFDLVFVGHKGNLSVFTRNCVEYDPGEDCDA